MLVHFFVFLIENRKSAIENSFYDFVRPYQHVGWNRQADLLRRLQIDDELELHRLLHGEFGWFGAFEDFIHVGRSAPGQVGEVCPI